MITLLLTFCLTTTGSCSSLKAEQSFATTADCDRQAQIMLAAIADYIAEHNLHAGYTCHVDPEFPKG